MNRGEFRQKSEIDRMKMRVKRRDLYSVISRTSNFPLLRHAMGIALFPTLGSLATPEATGTAFNSWPRQNQRGEEIKKGKNVRVSSSESRKEGRIRRKDPGFRSMQFSRGSIKDPGAQLAGALTRPLSPEPSLSPSSQIGSTRFYFADLICLFRGQPPTETAPSKGTMDELSASTGSNGLGVDRVIGGAISSFIKRIVLPSGIVLRSHIDWGRVANKRGGAGRERAARTDAK